MKDLLNPREAAEKLHISERTLRDLKKRGAIRYVALTERRIMYRPDDLADYINGRVRCDEQELGRDSKKRRASVSGVTQRKIIPFSERHRAS